MVKITGVNKYFHKTEGQKKLVRNGAANLVRKAAKAILRDLVLNTPQWSGETASSWQIELTNHPATWDRSPMAVDDWTDLIAEGPYFLGDKAALKVAYENAAPKLKAIRYNSKVAIVNSAPYADELATGSPEELKLRPGNFIPGDVMATKLVAAKYNLGSNIVGLDLKRIFI